MKHKSIQKTVQPDVKLTEIQWKQYIHQQSIKQNNQTKN